MKKKNDVDLCEMCGQMFAAQQLNDAPGGWTRICEGCARKNKIKPGTCEMCGLIVGVTKLVTPPELGWVQICTQCAEGAAPYLRDEKPIKLYPHRWDGYTLGHEACGAAGEIVACLGLADDFAHSVTQQGGKDAVEALGESFLFSAALAYAQPRNDAILARRRQKEEEQQCEKDRILGLFCRAQETGKPQKIRGWITDRCHNGNYGDCSFDSATELAMPDGTRKTEYDCCY